MPSAGGVKHGDFWGARRGEGQNVLDGDLLLSFETLDPLIKDRASSAVTRGEVGQFLTAVE